MVMTGWLRCWWQNHWQIGMCLRGWSRVICLADDLAHMLHLPARRLCDLHDRRLMRTMGDENDQHAEMVQQWWNTSASATATLGNVQVTYKQVNR